jgi:hypothetical protein
MAGQSVWWVEALVCARAWSCPPWVVMGRDSATPFERYVWRLRLERVLEVQSKPKVINGHSRWGPEWD